MGGKLDMNEINRMRELAGITTLREIRLTQVQPESGIDHDYIDGYGEFVFRVMEYPVYVKTASNQDLYTAIDGDETVAQIVFNNVVMPQYGDVYIAFRGFTNAQYRGNGIILKMMVDVRKHTDKTIISDEEITQDGMRTWEHLKQVFPVNLINIDTGDILPVSGNEDKLFSSSPRYTYIIERIVLNRIVECRSLFKSNEYFNIEAHTELMDF